MVWRLFIFVYFRGKHSVDKANPISSGEYDSRYTEVRKRDEDDSGRRSKEVDM